MGGLSMLAACPGSLVDIGSQGSVLEMPVFIALQAGLDARK